MALRGNILASLSIFLTTITWGQDTSRTLKPVPIFAQQDSILRIAVISSSIPHFILTKDRMEQLATTDVGAALKYIPGVQLKDYGGIGGIKTVSFRSLGASHTTVQVDGNQIPNVQSGVVNLSAFELFGLKEISFASGQSMSDNSTASSFVQANSIELHSILNERPTKMRWGVYSNMTSINAYEKGVYFQSLLGKQFFYGVQGMVRFGNGEYEFLNEDQSGEEKIRRENTALFNYRLRGVVGFENKKHKIVLSTYYNNNEQELPGAAVLYNPSNDQKLWNEDLRINLNQKIKGKRWNINSHLNYHSGFTRYYDPHYLNLQGYIDVTYQQQLLSGGVMATRHFRFLSEKVFFGSDINYANLTGNGIDANPFRLQNNSVIGGGTWIGRAKIDANLSAQFIHDTYLENNTSVINERFRLSPFVSLAVLPFKEKVLRLRAFYKSTFRMPTFNDLYYNFIGNNGLLPEDAHLFNAGITYGLSKDKLELEATVDAYRNKVENKIVAIPTKDIFNWSMQNIGETDIKGIDLGVVITYKINKVTITMNTNHSWNESLDVTDRDGTTYKHQIPYTPYYSSSHGLTAVWKGYGLNTNVLYSGYRFSLNENIYQNYLDPFTDIGVNVSKAFNIKQGELKIVLSAMNILDKNYQVIRSFPMPGRYYQLRVKLNWGK